jgi:hypothetical protein
MSTENVLQGILSQKIVQDGAGYAARTDIVNVDNITANSIVTGSITTGSINTSGTITSGGSSITASSLRLTSAAGPHIRTAGDTLQIATTTAANTAGFFDLNGNTIIDSGGNRLVLPAGQSNWSKYITLGANVNTNGFSIATQNGYIEIVDTIDMNTRSILRVDRLQLNTDSQQAGTITVLNGQSSQQITITTPPSAPEFVGVSSSSIVIVTPTSLITNRYWVTPGSGTITVNVNPAASADITFNYYIAKY